MIKIQYRKTRIMSKTLAFFVFVLSAASMQGQMGVTNNGNLQVHTGGSIASYSNFTNSATGALVNHGALYLKGNVTNNQASMAAGTGTLHLNGSSAQAIGGSQTFRTNNLNTNNSAGITLNNIILFTKAVHHTAAQVIHGM
jgi:hypothetical protein